MSERYYVEEDGNRWAVHDRRLTEWSGGSCWFKFNAEDLARFVALVLNASDDSDETMALFQRALAPTALPWDASPDA